LHAPRSGGPSPLNSVPLAGPRKAGSFRIDDRRKHASDLAGVALELASQGSLVEAEETYRQAIELATECDDHSLSQYQVQLGQVLARIGNREGAYAQLQAALSTAIRQNGQDESSPSLGIVRYFFAEFLVATDRSGEALDVLAPALVRAASLEPVLRFVEAEALWSLHRQADARQAAARALTLSKSEDQRARMAERLARLPGWTEAS
jgi:tetratricopeptide (TPR) repeat protein